MVGAGWVGIVNGLTTDVRCKVMVFILRSVLLSEHFEDPFKL